MEHCKEQLHEINGVTASSHVTASANSKDDLWNVSQALRITCEKLHENIQDIHTEFRNVLYNECQGLKDSEKIVVALCMSGVLCIEDQETTIGVANPFETLHAKIDDYTNMCKPPHVDGLLEATVIAISIAHYGFIAPSIQEIEGSGGDLSQIGILTMPKYIPREKLFGNCLKKVDEKAHYRKIREANLTFATKTFMQLHLIFRSCSNASIPPTMPEVSIGAVRYLFGLQIRTHLKPSDHCLSITRTTGEELDSVLTRDILSAPNPSLENVHHRLTSAVDCWIRRMDQISSTKKQRWASVLTPYDGAAWIRLQNHLYQDTETAEGKESKSSKVPCFAQGSPNQSSTMKRNSSALLQQKEKPTKKSRHFTSFFRNNTFPHNIKTSNKQSLLYHAPSQTTLPGTDSKSTSPFNINKSRDGWKYYPMYRLEAAVNPNSSLPDTIISPDQFLDVYDYLKPEIAVSFTQCLKKELQPGCVFAGLKIGSKVDIQSVSLMTGKGDAVAQVVVIQGLWAELERHLFFQLKNNVPVLNSSHHVGRNTKPKKRLFRCANTHGGSPYKLGSDDKPLMYETYTDDELKYKYFIDHLFSLHDDCIAKHNPPDKTRLVWVGDKNGCQGIIATLIDSMYGKHSDSSFHQNQELLTFDQINNPLQREIILRVVPTILMRVGTIVQSDYDGDEPVATLQFYDGNKIVASFDIQNNAVHLQLCGVQKFFQHAVICLKVPSQNTKVTVFNARIVDSYRQTLDSRDWDLIHKLGKRNGCTTPSVMYNDYTVHGALDYVNGVGKLRNLDRDKDNILLHGQKHGANDNTESSKKDGQVSNINDVGTWWSLKLIDAPGLCPPIIPLMRQTMSYSNEDKAPMTTVTRYITDKVPLVDRLGQPAFTDVLKASEIELHYRVITNNIEKPSPTRVKHTGKAGVQKSIAQQDISECPIATPPKLDVVSNWHGEILRNMADQPHYFEPTWTSRKCVVPGDIVRAEDLRQMNGYRGTEHTNPICRDDNHYLVNHVILTSEEKNQWLALQKIQEAILKGTEFSQIQPTRFHICGSGGCARTIGSNAMNTNSVKAYEPPPEVSVPEDQKLWSNKTNRILSDCDDARRIVQVYVLPNDFPKQFKGKQEQYVRYIGLYYFDGMRKEADSLEELIQDVPDWHRLHKEKQLLHSFRFMKHFKFWLQAYHPSSSVRVSNETIPGTLIVNVNSKFGKQHLSASYNRNDDFVLQIQGPFKSGTIFANKFQNDHLPDLIYSFNQRKWEDDASSNCFRPVLPDLQPPAALMQRKLEEEQMDLEYDSLLLDIGEKISVDSPQFLSMMIRVYIASAYRFLRKHVVEGDASSRGRQLPPVATYIIQEPEQKNLGEVLQSCPLPCSNRCYDLGTQFFMELVRGTHGGKTIPKNNNARRLLPLQSRSGFERLVIGDLSDEELNSIVLTSLILRLTGKVEMLRWYLQCCSTASTKTESYNQWKRLFSSQDIHHLPAFIAQTSGTKKESAQMHNWIGTQFKSTLPESATESAETFHELLLNIQHLLLSRNFMKSLRDDTVDVNDLVGEVASILEESSLHNVPKLWNNEFVAAYLISDLTEVLQSKENTEDNWEPFIGEHIHPGYGGNQGYTVYKRGKSHGAHPTRPEGNTQVDKILNYKKSVLKRGRIMYGFIEDSANDAELLQLGLFRSNGNVYVIYNHRKFGMQDVEHMWCKLYLLCSRYRGSRAYSKPEPWSSSCHPTVSTDVVNTNPDLCRIFKQGIQSYKDSIANGSLQPLSQPFLLFDPEKSKNN
jgi:hypothetical protein